MKRMIFFIGFVTVSFTLLNCKKSKTENESTFYGMWTKGTNAGDTLLFYKKNERNILSYNASFNSALPSPIEVDYWYIDGN